MTTSEAILILTRSIENEYGSTEKAPDNDERKIAIQQWYKETAGMNVDFENKLNAIRHCWLAGMTDHEIIEETDIDPKVVYYQRKKLGKRNADIYRLMKNGKTHSFKRTQATRFLSIGRNSSREKIIEVAKNNGYVVRVVRSHDY